MPSLRMMRIVNLSLSSHFCFLLSPAGSLCAPTERTEEMLILISLVTAILGWLLRRALGAQRRFLALKIRYADVGAIYQQPSLVSTQYGLSGRPDYLVRVDCGVVPVELKSGNLPGPGDHTMAIFSDWWLIVCWSRMFAGRSCLTA